MKKCSLKINRNNCKHKWIKNGFKNGKQIWICSRCGKSKSIKRKDIVDTSWGLRIIDFILEDKYPKDFNYSRRWLDKKINEFRCQDLCLPPITEICNQLIIDGKYISNNVTYLIIHDGTNVRQYLKCTNESAKSWKELLSKVPPHYMLFAMVKKVC